MRLALGGALLWWLASACGSDPTAGNLPPEPTSGSLAFTQGGKLYITSADSGAVPRQIGEGYYYVSWSPDGSTLALVEPLTVSLADAEGGNVRVLYRLEGIGYQFALSPEWYPDGTSILVNFGSAHNHWLASLSTLHPTDGPGGLEFLPEEYLPECHPVGTMRAPAASWSPDGRHFVVNGVSYQAPMICIFSAAGELERALVPGIFQLGLRTAPGLPLKPRTLPFIRLRPTGPTSEISRLRLQPALVSTFQPGPPMGENFRFSSTPQTSPILAYTSSGSWMPLAGIAADWCGK